MYDAIIEIIIPIVAVLATAWLALFVNKKSSNWKERKKIADKINIQIRKALREIEAGVYPSVSVKQEDIDHLLIYTDKRSGEALSSAYNDYMDVISQHMSNVFYNRTAEENILITLGNSLKKLMTFVERK